MSPDFPKTFDCGITVPRQDRAEDCWAAVAAAVVTKVTGTAVSQDDVRAKVIGTADRPLPWPDVAAVYELYGVTGIGPDLPLSAPVLRDEMEAGRAVMWGYQWDRGGGHVALVTGWRSWTGRFLIQDPYFGPGELSYGELMAAYGIGRAVVCWGRFALKEKQ